MYARSLLIISALFTVAASAQLPKPGGVSGDFAALSNANLFTAGQEIRRDGIGSTSTQGLALRNTTAAAAGAQQYPPYFELEGRGWKTDATAASQSVRWRMEVVPVQGAAAPSARLDFGYSIAGGAFTTAMSVEETGAIPYLVVAPSSASPIRLGWLSALDVGLWLGQASPSFNNFALYYGSNFTRLGAPSGGTIGFNINGGDVGSITTTRWNVPLSLGIGTTAPARLLHASLADTAASAVSYVQRLTHTNSTASTGGSAGMGVGLEFFAETATDGTNAVQASIETAWTTATAGAEDGYMKLRTMRGGTLTDALTIDKDGIIQPSGGYKSTDGTAGATVTSCTSFKNGLCVAGT